MWLLTFPSILVQLSIKQEDNNRIDVILTFSQNTWTSSLIIKFFIRKEFFLIA